MADAQADRDGPAPDRPAPRKGAVTPLSLLERVRANDPEAWRRLVELYQPLVRCWCQRGGAGHVGGRHPPGQVSRAAPHQARGRRPAGVKKINTGGLMVRLHTRREFLAAATGGLGVTALGAAAPPATDRFSFYIIGDTHY